MIQKKLQNIKIVQFKKKLPCQLLGTQLKARMEKNLTVAQHVAHPLVVGEVLGSNLDLLPHNN